MKKNLLLIAALTITTLAASAQSTKQYIKIETTKFKSDKLFSKLVKYEGGTIDLTAKTIYIDKEAPKPQYYDIARTGALETADEGYFTQEYICITENKSGAMKAVKVVAVYTPKKELCDLIVKTGKTNVDYCLTDK